MADEEDIILCAYEVARLKQIQQNKKYLESLGLEKIGGPPQETPSEDDSKVQPRRKKRKRREVPPVRKVPRRRSARVANRPAVEEENRKEKLAEEDRYEQYKLLVELQNQKGGARLPPRATYEHTVDRVRSMSEKGLANRIRAIERANGTYAVLKQRMFAEVLIIEGYDKLAKEAEASYKRLKRLRKSK
jgi:hypothetical protein